MARRPAPRHTRTVLLVHPDLAALAAFQSAFSAQGFTSVVARDVSTALLAMTQHFLDAAVICSRIREEGDGWPLGGVLRFVFPQAFVAVLAPETSVSTLQAAINHRLDTIFEQDAPAEDIAAAVQEKLGPTPSSQESVN